MKHTRTRKNFDTVKYLEYSALQVNKTTQKFQCFSTHVKVRTLLINL